MAKKKTALYRVEWAITAQQDFDEIIEYILARDPVNAMKVLVKIESKASTLKLMPDRGRMVPELKSYGIVRYREIQIRPWRLIYRVDEHSVIVVSVIDGRRQLNDLLLERFLREETS